MNIKPPKVSVPGKGGGFWKTLGMMVLGTTISLMLTVAVAALLDAKHRAADRRLSAMMVMSNIERFARLLDANAESMAAADTAAVWLLSKSVDDLEKMPFDQLSLVLQRAITCPSISYDKSAENIFSNHIDTWKNVGNVQFIDNVGECFSMMRQVEEYWNKRMLAINDVDREVAENPDAYSGSNWAVKMLRLNKTCLYLQNVDQMRAWLRYVAESLRVRNRMNMDAIGITEQEVMEYTDSRERESEKKYVEPVFLDFYHDRLHADNLVSMSAFDSLLENTTNKR